MQSRVPSGLFPSGPLRPTFREPHPVRISSVVLGAGMALAWQILLAGFSDSLRGLFWRCVAAVLVAWGVAGLLLRFGDRGAAAGVALASSLGGCVAAILVTVRWLTVGWPLW
ncbi:MAG TPA: hypothetical protein VH561_12120 [Micromonosporaceae bacterium]